jgi:hypothetical protein
MHIEVALPVGGISMSTTVARMTKDELQEVIAAVVEQKLIEVLGDPDGGLPLRESLLKRLRRQVAAVARGQRGEQLEDVARRLGLE